MVDAMVIKEYESQQAKFGALCDKIVEILSDALKDADVKFQVITKRVKEPSSFKDKIEANPGKYSAPISDIDDLAACRVIVYYESDVSKVAEIVEKAFLVINRDNVIGEAKDAKPTTFEYCLPRLVVQLGPVHDKLLENQTYSKMKCEIQIRTVLEHAWAEVEHQVYKRKNIPARVRRQFAQLQAIVENVDRQFDQLRNDIQSLPETQSA